MATWGEILAELVGLGKNPPSMPAGTSTFDYVRRRYLAALSQYSGRSTILYAVQWTRGDVEPGAISIGPSDINGFMEVVHGLPGGPLDLILYSPGGSAESAEAIVTYLRSKFDDIRVIIPHAAMSAATMLACASNTIVMGKHSFIGPIDPQFILQTALGRQMVPAHAILEQFALAQAECRNQQNLPSWMPILQQYGPALIVQCKLAQELSKELVSKWLEQYMLASQANAGNNATAIAEALADHGQFKSHGRFIDRVWARQKGLLIDDLESDQAFQDKVLSVFHAAVHTLNATAAVKLIENNLGKAYIQQQKVVQISPPPSSAPPPPPPPGA